MTTAGACLRAGASDVFTWRDPAHSARHVAERLRRWHMIDELVGCRHVREFLVGDSPAWQAVLREAVEVAQLHRRRGAGHRRERHRQGAGGAAHPRARSPAEQGQARRPGLQHGRAVAVRAASSSATRRVRSPAPSAAREGAFELANGGTLFLDEVGELTGGPAGRAAPGDPGGDVQAGRQQHVAQEHVPAGLRDEPRRARRSRPRAPSATTSTTGSPAARCTCRACAIGPRTSSRCSGTSSARCTLTANRPRSTTPSATCSSTGPIPATCGTCAAWCCASPTGTWATGSSPSATSRSRSGRIRSSPRAATTGSTRASVAARGGRHARRHHRGRGARAMWLAVGQERGSLRERPPARRARRRVGGVAALRSGGRAHGSSWRRRSRIAARSSDGAPRGRRPAVAGERRRAAREPQEVPGDDERPGARREVQQLDLRQLDTGVQPWTVGTEQHLVRPGPLHGLLAAGRTAARPTCR